MFIDDLKGFKTESKPIEVEIKGNFYCLVSLFICYLIYDL